MALEYQLVLPLDIPIVQVAERAFPDPVERPTGTNPLHSADLSDRYGFEISILAGENGYFDAVSDTGPWLWQPRSYVLLNFRMDKFADPARLVGNMLDVVRRVLDSGPEDAALLFNGDLLLLTRLGDNVAKHRRNWWNTYPGANDRFPA